MLDPELVAENQRLRGLIGEASLLLNPAVGSVVEKLGRSRTLDDVVRAAMLALLVLAKVDDPKSCEHGISDGEFCDQCNRESKVARMANGDGDVIEFEVK